MKRSFHPANEAESRHQSNSGELFSSMRSSDTTGANTQEGQAARGFLWDGTEPLSSCVDGCGSSHLSETKSYYVCRYCGMTYRKRMPVQTVYHDSTVSTRADQDICQNRHRGAETSVAAHDKIKDSKAAKRAQVFRMIEATGDYGLTVDELADLWNTTPNAVSGRFSELARDGRITKKGTRKTRSGCQAAVWQITK